MTFEPLSDHFQPLPVPFVPSTPPPPPAPFSLSSLLLSDIPTTPLTWLWPTRIPLGHLTLLDATPDCDPSLFALTIAASISSGSPLPDGTPITQGNVLLFAPYDSASTTLKPRLQAAGGDPAHVMLFQPSTPPSPLSSSSSPSSPFSPLSSSSPFTLPRDLPQLAATIRFIDARLLILDPASAIPGLTRSLPALAELAQQTNCAILLIRSIRSPSATVTNPLHSPVPPSPLLEAARSRILLTPAPANENHTLVLTTRHLLCPQPTILAYETRYSTAGISTLFCLGEQDRPQLARLCTGPLYSPHRQAILHFLQNSTTPQTLSAILNATSYDHEAGRKMLTRMKLAGELHSPARGLYTIAATDRSLTTPTNPTNSSLTIPTTNISPVPNVPTIPPIDLPPVSLVPNTPTIPLPKPSQLAAGPALLWPPPHPACTLPGGQVIAGNNRPVPLELHPHATSYPTLPPTLHFPPCTL